MTEYIFTLGDPVFNEETREAVFRPEVVGTLVRCKDCKHWYQDADSGMACEFTNMSQSEDGFCNWAEKKDGDSDED